MEETKPTLVLDHVTKRYGEFTAVNDLSLKVRPGRVFGLIGPNGAGKTTTIRMIVNIIAPDSGSVELFGQKMTTALQDRIGYLPEERGLYKKMKVGEQLRFFAELKNLRGKDADQRNYIVSNAKLDALIDARIGVGQHQIRGERMKPFRDRFDHIAFYHHSSST